MSSFDFSSLKKVAPRDVLHLGSLGQVLDSLDKNTLHDEADDADMPDASIDKVDEPLEPAVPEKCDPKPQDVPSTESHQAPIQIKAPEADVFAHTSSPHNSSLSLLHPSSLGAQRAVHHAIEVDMPIPAPWHENFAYTASTYLHLGFKGTILALFGWFVALLVKDVNSRVQQSTSKMIIESSACAREYVENECRPGLMRPALQQFCQELEACMDRDPSGVYRINMLANSLAEAINEFFEPLSTKAVILLLLSVAAAVYFADYSFGFIRARTLTREVESPTQRVKCKLTPINVNAS